MDKPSQKSKVNIISDINLATSEVGHSTDNVVTTDKDDQNALIIKPRSPSPENGDSEKPVMFKNLSFSFPKLKRKNDDFENKEHKKKSKIEINDSDSDNDEEIKVFNYLTGTYETIKRQFNEESIEPSEEPMLDEEVTLVEEKHPDTQPSPYKDAKMEIPDTSWVNSLGGFKIIKNVDSLKHVISNNDSIESSIKGEPLNRSSSSIFKCNESSNTITQASNLETQSESPILVLSSRSNSPVDFKQPPLIASNLQFPTVANTVNYSAAVTTNGNIVLNSYIIMPVQRPDSRVDVNLESKPTTIPNEHYNIPETKFNTYSSPIILKKLFAGGSLYKTGTVETGTASINLSSESASNTPFSPNNNIATRHSTTRLLTEGQSYEITTSTTCLPIRSSSSNKVQIHEQVSLKDTSQVSQVESPKTSTSKDAHLTKPPSPDEVSLRLYKCPTCYDLSKSRFALVSHIFTTHLRTPLDLLSKCENCDFTCDNERVLEKHEESHSNLKSILCPVCDIVYQTNTRLVSHICSNHLQNYEFRLKCSVCYFECLSKIKMDRHENRHKKDNLNSTQSDEDNAVSFQDHSKKLDTSQNSCVELAKNKASLKCASCELECRDATELHQHRNCRKKVTSIQDTIEISSSDDDSGTDAFDTSVTVSSHIEEDNGVTYATLLPVKFVSDSQAASSNTTTDATIIDLPSKLSTNSTQICGPLLPKEVVPYPDTRLLETDTPSELATANNAQPCAPSLPKYVVPNSDSSLLKTSEVSQKETAETVPLKCALCEFECIDQTELNQHQNCHKKSADTQESIDIISSDSDEETNATPQKQLTNTTQPICIMIPKGGTVSVPVQVVDKQKTADSGVNKTIIAPILAKEQKDKCETDDECVSDSTDQSDDDWDSDTEADKEKSMRFYCYDCHNSVNGTIVQLRSHVAKHIGSKFCCMRHLYDRNKDCLRCRYEKCLNNIQKYIKSCNTCGFATADSSVLAKHIHEEYSCQVWSTQSIKPGELKCFHCNYVTSRKRFLEFHAVDHVLKDFSCDKHKTKKEDKEGKCLDCIYEVSLEKAKRDILECGDCGYKTILIELFDVHTCTTDTHKKLSQVINNCSNDFQCGHCNYKTDKSNLLTYHCKEHYDKSFECAEHPKLKPSGCDKCTYLNVLNRAKSALFTCKKCSFFTFNGFRLRKHINSKCDSAGGLEYLKCFDCDIGYLQTLHLEKHAAVKHLGSNFRCTNHSDSYEHTCLMCIYQKIIKDMKKGKSLHTSKSKTTFRNYNSVLKCFECHIDCPNVNQLRDHVATKHSGSDFTCTDHSVFVRTCLKCIYENIIKDVKQCRSTNPEYLKCFDCDIGYIEKTHLEKHAAAKHIHSNFRCTDHSASNVPACLKCIYQKIITDVKSATSTCTSTSNTVGASEPEHLKCFECDMKCANKDQWKEHAASEHVGSDFTCSEHSAFIYTCLKCTYQKIIQYVKRETFMCKTCGFKSYTWGQWTEHVKNCDNFGARGPGKTVKSRHTVDVELVKTFSCFDCFNSNIFEDESELRQHISAIHRKSSFACTRHFQEQNSDGCDKCFYWRIVKDVLKDQYAVPLICWDCKEEQFRQKESLGAHIISKHLNSKFECVEHGLANRECSKCLYEIMLKSCNKKLPIFKCFDCDFSCEKLHVFRKHVYFLHRHSQFQCAEHVGRSNSFFEKCPRCFYYMIAKHRHAFFKCFACITYITPPGVNNLLDLKKHILKYHVNTKELFVCRTHTIDTNGTQSINCAACWFERFLTNTISKKETLFQCYRCSYKIYRLDLFKRHITEDHENYKYDCKIHRGRAKVNFEECPKCFCAAIGMDQRKNNISAVLRCYECAPATVFSFIGNLRNHLLEAHETSTFKCRHPETRINCGQCWFQCYAQRVLEEEQDFFYCFECTFQTNSYKSLKTHVGIMHKHSEFKCDKHVTASAQEDSCKKCSYAQLVQKNSSIFRCYKCDTQIVYFADLKSLKSHIRKKNAAFSFVCPQHASADDRCEQCEFQAIVEETFSYNCEECPIGTLQLKTGYDLKRHIQNTHLNSKFTCNQHCLNTEPDVCSKCAYESLVQTVQKCINDSNNVLHHSPRHSMAPRTRLNLANGIQFVCFDCDFRVFDVRSMKDHIRQNHMDSTFMCTKHSLGDIDDACAECSYENLALLSKEELEI